jgi:hypothetical protein
MCGRNRERVREENIVTILFIFLYCTANRWMRWAVHVARFGLNRNKFTGLSTETNWKRTLERGYIYIFNQFLQKFHDITWIRFMKLWVQLNTWDALFGSEILKNDSDTL